MYKKPLHLVLEEKGFLTLNQLVRYLKQYHPDKSTSYPTMQRWIENGLMEYTRFGGQFRIKRDQIERFCQFGTQGPPQVGNVSPPVPVETVKEVAENPNFAAYVEARQHMRRQSDPLEPGVQVIPPKVGDEARIEAERPLRASLASLYGIDEENQEELRRKLHAHEQEYPNDPGSDEPQRRRGRPIGSRNKPKQAPSDD